MKPVSRQYRHRHLAASMGLIAALALTAGQGAPAQAEAGAGIAPQTIDGRDIVQIEAGLGHSCALVDNGWVYCWGANFVGQLGDGTTSPSLQPVRVAGLAGVEQISTGQDHSCALRTTGRVFCWGSNSRGQLGDGSITSRSEPVRVVNLTGVTQVAAGRFHSCALRSTERVFCWGRNDDGQLGDGTTVQRPTPVRVEGAAATQAIQVAGGAAHSCLLRRNGRVSCWGANSTGQLGDGTTTERPLAAPIGTLNNVTQIAVGYFHSCALRGSGRLFCWGSNFFGQVGNGTNRSNALSPVRVVDLTSVTTMALGFQHSCAVRSTGRVFCWGSNTDGQLGIGSTDEQSRPVRVAGSLMVNATRLGLGSVHSCGVRANGRAYCWGLNQSGQLGDGTQNNSLIPVRAGN